MILLYLLISLISLCYGQNAALSFECPEAGEDILTIEAVYSGTGTPSTVIWTYSGTSLTVVTSSCTVFGPVPAGFIDSSRLSFKCITTDTSLPANTYQLIVSGLQDDVLGKTWAVTFTPPGGAAPPAVSLDAPSDCSVSIFQFQQVEAQSTVSGTESGSVILPCSLTGGSFTLPEWLGPPNDLIYTILNDASEKINPNAPAASRLQFASNKRDLVMSNAQLNDSGVYKCSYTALGEHTVTLTVTAESCTCDCKCRCKKMVIASIVIGIVGAIILSIVVGGTVKEYFGRKTALVVDSIGILCGVTSFVLGIVVQAIDCCKASDCCEDSDCCKDECERNWIENTGAAFIVIGGLVGIAGGVIFYRVWSGRIGRGYNGITKKDLRPSKETVCEKLLRVLESAYPKILLVKDLIRKVDAEESVVMEQLEELKRKDLIRQLDSGGFVRHFLDVKTGITKQDLRPLEDIVCEKLLHVLESVYPNILSVKDLIRIDFAVESVVMEQLEELRRKDLIRQLDSGGFVRHFLDVQTAYKAEEAKEPGENDRMMETSN